mgnify:CR=1 FL=1
MDHPTVHVRIAESPDVIRARQAGRDLAVSLGFGKVDQIRIATAISELARNILQHSGTTGDVTLRAVTDHHRTGVEILVCDAGVGIADVERALQDGYSSAGSLGAGLPGSRRLMDHFDIQTAPGKGVRIHMERWRR